jgi:hypothetical protein
MINSFNLRLILPHALPLEREGRLCLRHNPCKSIKYVLVLAIAVSPIIRKNMRNFLNTSILALLFSVTSTAQNTITEEIFRLIYSRKYDSAQALLQINQTEIDPLYFAVLKIDCSYWKNVTGTTTPNYPDFEKTLQHFMVDSAKTDNEKAIQLITLSYRLRYQLKRFQLFGALSTRKQTMDLFHELQPQADSLPITQQKLFQLYNALIVYFDNFLKPFFVKEKRIKMDQAIRDMDKLTHSNQLIVQTLSNYFVGKIYLEYENEPGIARTYFQWLTQTFPDNLKFEEYLEKSD